MTIAATQPVSLTAVWLGRLRFVLATAAMWALLHYLVSGFVLLRGLERPIVLVASPHLGPMAGLLVVAAIWIGAVLAALITGARDCRKPLMIVGLGLALWAAEGGRLGGTMDCWLILQNEIPGPPSSAPYWLLLGDYALLLLGVGGAALIAGALASRRSTSAGESAEPRERRNSGVTPSLGLAALLTTTVVGCVAMVFLTGLNEGRTMRGQVYFAVGAGLLLGTYLAMRFVKVRDPRWYWPAPILLGVIGLVVAGVAPDLMLPETHRHLDVLPAWGPVRALPVEMVGVGLVATLALVKPERAEASQAG